MSVLPATCELFIDGVRYPDGQPGEDPGNPFAVSGLSIQWGRDNTLDQPGPAQCTFTVLDPPGGTVRFDDTVRLGSAVAVYSTVAGGSRVMVYGGRVTDLTASFDDAAGAGQCKVAVADTLADLANRYVGAEPWAAQPLVDRAVGPDHGGRRVRLPAVRVSGPPGPGPLGTGRHGPVDPGHGAVAGPDDHPGHHGTVRDGAGLRQ
jgi:hypothetical protein